ncbi:hypothetical protein RFI_32978, partial [Reticulomyxa filosa]
SQRPLATIPEQEIASNTPTITPIKSIDECDDVSENMKAETAKDDSNKQEQQLLGSQQQASVDGLAQMSTWNNHCLYVCPITFFLLVLGMCGVDPQSMVPKGLITKLEDPKLKGVSSNSSGNGSVDVDVFAQLMSQLPSLRCGTSNLPEALAEMHNLVTPMEGLAWNWNANVNIRTNNTNTNTNTNTNKNKNKNINTNTNPNTNANVNVNAVQKSNKKTTYKNAKDPVEQVGGILDHLTWENIEHSVIECSVAPIYHPHTLYQAAQRVHRSIIRKKCNLQLCCDFVVQLSNNWPSFSFGPSDKGFETLCNRVVNDMKYKHGRTNVNLSVSELSLESIGSETQSLSNSTVVEKINVSLATLCTQLSLGFVLCSNQGGKSFTHWLKDMVTNLAFIVELYLYHCLDFHRVHLLMLALADKNEEWSWKVLCETLTTYGQRLESTQESMIQIYFDRMHVRCQTKQQSREELAIQAILLNTIELRKYRWQRVPNKTNTQAAVQIKKMLTIVPTKAMHP